MSRTIKVDLFTDVVCPWCLIGSKRLDDAIAKLPAEVTVDVENLPFYLDPNTPPEGYDVAEMLRSKYGRDPKTIWAHAEEQARLSGIDLDLSKQPRTVSLPEVGISTISAVFSSVSPRSRNLPSGLYWKLR